MKNTFRGLENNTKIILFSIFANDMKETSNKPKPNFTILFEKAKKVKAVLKSNLEGEELNKELTKLGITLYAPELPGIIKKQQAL